MKARLALGLIIVVAAGAGLSLLATRPPVSKASTVRALHAPAAAVPMPDFEGDIAAATEGRRDAAARLEKADPFHLETAFLDRSRFNQSRSRLLRIIEDRGDALSRAFVLSVLQDRTEDITVRMVALDVVGRRKDDEGCEAILELWRADVSWPADARYHLILALGLNGRPVALPVVRACAGPMNAVSMRGAAVQALASWIQDAGVRDHLKNVAANDGVQLIRVNALGALAASKEPDVDEFFRQMASRNDEAGRAARAFLDARKR